MKTLLTLLALHLSTLLMAQEVNPFVKDPSAQQRWKSNYEKSSAFQEVLRLSRLEDSNYFFPYDMNQDGKIDLIYEGPRNNPSLEGIISRIYLNIGNRLEEIISMDGQILAITDLPFNLGKQLVVIDQSCCDDPFYTIQYAHCWIQESTLSVSYSKEIVYNGLQGELPEQLTMNQTFRIDQDIYNLRTTPLLNEKNIITQYKKNDKGIAIATKTDTNGKRWWFVIMKNELGPQQAGWMSSKYLVPYFE